MVEEEIKIGRGRPRKFKEKIKYSSKTFYFSANKGHQLVWDEFVKLCKGNKQIGYFSKDEHAKTGINLRRYIYTTVIQDTEDDEKQQIALKLLLDDINECITRYNKYHGKDEPMKTEEQIVEFENETTNEVNEASKE